MSAANVNSPNGADAGGNPCLSCGACCGFFRVGFHWMETSDGRPDGVPVEMVDVLDLHRVAMKGTTAKPVRCVALAGEIGGCVSCTIHPRRSSACREFAASWEGGVANPDCDRARAAFGLAPLERGWWTEKE